MTDGLEIRVRSRLAQGHHRLTEQHIFESPGFEANGAINFQLLTNRWEEKGKDFIAFVSNLEKLSYREQRGTSMIIQHCKGENRKFKFHVMESVWMNLKMK